ncbi:MAG: arginine--tRNA ligase [Opitutales bacterium]
MRPWFHLCRELETILTSVATGQAGLDPDFQPDVRPADPRFGDYQANGVLAYAKAHKTNPRAVARQLVDTLKAAGTFDPADVTVSIAGPGFINLKLSPAFLTRWLQTYRSEEALRAAAGETYAGRKVVVDFSSPNTAKQMHVGHIRSTVIGEAIARLLAFCGATVHRDNHIGDWGTAFGMLILAIKREGANLDAMGPQDLPEIERLYKAGYALTRESEDELKAARRELVKLQNGDAENRHLWRQITRISWDAFQEIYDRLGITYDTVLGESFYEDQVGDVCAELEKLGIAEESQGALVVFHPEHPRFARQPFIIRKSDGASNYATTDLATARYRVEALGADSFIVLTDARQQDHFQQLFLTVDKWFKATGRPVPGMHHVWFGTVLGEDGKAIKTKSGEPVRLRALLDEAVDRARAVVLEKNPDLPAAERDRIAEVVGIGAVRYADLAQNRTSDYIFNWDKVLSFEGNTAPYLLYAGARIHSILRKAGLNHGQGEDGASDLETEQELALARKLLAFVDAVDMTLADLRPHVLCTYLFELAGAFSSFYNADKVMTDDPGTRARRILLCNRTLTVLQTGLHLLGLETLERM